VGSSSLLRDHLGGPLGAQLTGEMGAAFKRAFGGFSSDTLVLLRLKGQSYSSRLTAPGQNQLFGEHDHSGEAIARTQWQHGLGSATAEVSLEGAYNWLGTSSSFAFNNFAVPLPNARATVTERRGEGTAKLTWAPLLVLQVEGGLRLEYSQIASDADIHQEKTLFFPKPRLAVTYTPDKANQFRLRAEREVGQLDFTNFVAASALDTGGVHSGNTDIEPQEAWVFEAAYEYRFWSGGSAGATLRHSLIANAVDRVPVRDPSGLTSTFDAPGNIGSGSLDMAQLDLALPLDRLGLGGARIKASGILQWSDVADPTTGVRRAISDMRPAEYSLEFRQDLSGWRMAWGASLTSSCWGVTANDDCTRAEYRFNEVDNYAIGPALDLFVEYQPRADIFLRVEADNLLSGAYDRRVESYGGPRGIFPPSYTDDRRLQTARFVHLSLRKSL
jgi:outer membrane receptor protein involved in Fe transport